MTKKVNKTMQPRKPTEQEIEVVHKFLANQEKDLQIRAQSFDIEKQKDANQFEYAKFAVEKQLELEKYSMDHHLKKQIPIYWLAGCISALVAAVVTYAMASGHIDVAMRILEIIATAVISGAGGYQIGKNKQEKLLQTKETPPK